MLCLCSRLSTLGLTLQKLRQTCRGKKARGMFCTYTSVLSHCDSDPLKHYSCGQDVFGEQECVLLPFREVLPGPPLHISSRHLTSWEFK